MKGKHSNMNDVIHVTSEIGRLKTVMLHRPGTELENLMPEYLTRQLFDDIPYLVHAREEHDAFADTLRNSGVTVLYLLDLAAEAVDAGGVREQIIDEYIREAGDAVSGAEDAVRAFLSDMPVRAMLSAMASGVRKSQVRHSKGAHLSDFVGEAYPFHIDPMPNLYFTRDPFSNIANGVMISRMANEVRRRETLFAKYIFTYHPVYGNVPRWHEREQKFSIEGGDVLVLSRDTVAVGLSQRTDPNAVEEMAKTLLCAATGIKRILAIDIPKVRAYMHLDTVMTMVDRDKFTIHPSILPGLHTFVLTMRDGRLHIDDPQKKLRDILRDVLCVDDVEMISCGGGSPVDAAREQWNDGANTLAIAPGEVIAFSRNYVTNGVLRDRGLVVHEIPSAELSRGRGGPRCMSMPFVREEP